MESLQPIEFFEELSDEQLISISGGVSVGTSGPGGTIQLSVDSSGVTYKTNGDSTGSSETTVNQNGLSTARTSQLVNLNTSIST